MWRLGLLVLLGLLLSLPSSAQMTLMQTGGAIQTTSGPPPTCPNSLDLSQSCNSQFLGTLRF